MGNSQSEEITKLSSRIDQLNNTLRDEREEKQEEINRLQERLNQIQINQDKERSQQARISELRRDALALKPGCTLRFSSLRSMPDVLNVGIFGTTGTGKTSLLNSLLYAVMGSLKPMHKLQSASRGYQGGHTMERYAVDITRYISFIDNRGIKPEDLATETVLKVLEEQLRGRGSFFKRVDWKRPQETPREISGQKIYCSVLIFNGRNPDGVRNIITPIAEFLKEWQGRYPIAVITHVDVASPAQLDNMRLILHSAGIGDIYEVANITDKNPNLENKYQINLLEFLQMCMNHGDRTYEHRLSVEEQ